MNIRAIYAYLLKYGHYSYLKSPDEVTFYGDKTYKYFILPLHQGGYKKSRIDKWGNFRLIQTERSIARAFKHSNLYPDFCNWYKNVSDKTVYRG